MIPSEQARRRIAAVFAALDYGALGAIYCDEGGDAFWDAHREPARQKGIEWAAAAAARLEPGGASLFVGAGVAELPALITEIVDLRRSVRAVNLERGECEVLNAALDGLVEVEAIDAHSVGGRYDHLCMVSVLSDPVRYPVTSAVSYGRIPAVHVDVPAFESERRTLHALVDTLLGGLERPGVLTTTFEEVPWILAGVERLGFRVDADEELVETAIVGDPLGFLTIA